MRRVKWMLKIVTIMMLCMGFVCCGDDDDNKEENGDSQRNYSAYEKEMISKLTETSWKLWKTVTKYGSSEKVRSEDATISFAKDKKLYYNNCYIIEGYYVHGDGIWDFWDNKLSLIPGVSFTNLEKGELVGLLGASSEIVVIDDSQLILSERLVDRYLYKVSYIGNSWTGTGGDNGGESTDTGDAPYVTSFDYTATKTSITVKFMCSERPTSATVKYGTSSATKTVSSSISGKQVKATASGLKAGTKYYFKCTIRNSNGSSESDGWTAMTTY